MKKLNTKELSKQTAELLRSMIQKKNMQPGDRFPSERELIELFGVGRSTVREAVKILVAENLLEIHRGNGTYISKCPGLVKDPLGLQYSPQQKLLQNLFEARAIIEPQIAALAAERAEPEDVKKLEDAMLAHSSCNGKENIAEADIRFHTALTNCCHNEVLQRFVPLVIEAIQEGGCETAEVPNSWENAKEYHKEIYEKVKCGDGEAARQAMMKHLKQTAKEANIRLNIGGTKK